MISEPHPNSLARQLAYIRTYARSRRVGPLYSYEGRIAAGVEFEGAGYGFGDGAG